MPSVPPKTSPVGENMKTGTGSVSYSENESANTKYEDGTGALDTVENESGSVKHKNGTRRPRYHPKRV
jgi:hypothetical protein